MFESHSGHYFPNKSAEDYSTDDFIPKSGPNNAIGFEIWFVGINISKHKAYYNASNGTLERLTDGVYINTSNPDWMPPMTPERRKGLILLHAPRIASFIYSDSFLSGCSAYHQGAVDGALYLNTTSRGKYLQRDIGGVLTISHSTLRTEMPTGTPLRLCEVEDSFGKLLVPALPDELMILQDFSAETSEANLHPRLSLTDLHSVIERTALKYGSKKKLLERLAGIASELDLGEELRLATDVVERCFGYSQKKRHLFEYHMYWNELRAGTLCYDGMLWRFNYEPSFKLGFSLAQKLPRGAVPSFIGSILPEKSEIDSVLEEGFDEFKLAERYLTNITVRRSYDAMAHATFRPDRLEGRLKQFWAHGFEFAGKVDEKLFDVLNLGKDNPDIISIAMYHPRTPRMSGVQIKLAGHLAEDGTLSLVDSPDKPFTHLIKPPKGGEYSSVGSMEWYGMVLARQCKLATEGFAVADLGGSGPSFIAERFDIRQDSSDRSMILMEDFWSIYGLQKQQHKYSKNILDVAKTVLAHSTSPEDDARMLFKQVLFSWLIGNSDLHLKNLSMIKFANKDLSAFDFVRLSPAYDLLTTRVYPGDPRSAALPIGTSKHYSVESFKELGAVLKITNAEVEESIKDMLARLAQAVVAIPNNLPAVVQNHALSVKHIHMANEMILARCRKFEEQLASLRNENSDERAPQYRSRPRVR